MGSFVQVIPAEDETAKLENVSSKEPTLLREKPHGSNSTSILEPLERTMNAIRMSSKALRRKPTCRKEQRVVREMEESQLGLPGHPHHVEEQLAADA